MFKSRMLDVIDYEWEQARKEKKEIELISEQVRRDSYDGYITNEDFYTNRDFNLVKKGIEKFVNDYKLNSYYDERVKRYGDSDIIQDYVEIAIWSREKSHKDFCRKQCRML